MRSLEVVCKSTNVSKPSTLAEVAILSNFRRAEQWLCGGY
jgi:hypothetical protein